MYSTVLCGIGGYLVSPIDLEEARVRHRECKERLDPVKMRLIEWSPNPVAVVRSLAKQEPERACAILDSMSPNAGALIFCLLKTEGSKPLCSANIWHILRRADVLRISCVPVLNTARRKIYEETQGQICMP